MNKTFSSTKRISLRQQEHRSAVGSSARNLKSGYRSVKALRSTHEVGHVDAQVVAGSTASARMIVVAGVIFPAHSRTLMGRRSDEARMVVLTVAAAEGRI